MKTLDWDAFSEGTPEDRAWYEANAKQRRSNLTVESAMQLILSYLNQMVAMEEKNIRRYAKEKDSERLYLAEKRKEWTENMLYWIGRNI